MCTLIPDSLDLETSALGPYKKVLKEFNPELIVIGFGVRGQGNEFMTRLFEGLIRDGS